MIAGRLSREAAREMVRLALDPGRRSHWPAGTAILGLIVLTLPLEVSKLLFPIELIEIARLLMVVGVALLAWRIARRQWLAIPRGLSLATGLVIVVAAGSVAISRWPGGERELAAMVAYALVALFVSQVVRTTPQLGYQSVLLSVSGAAAALIVIAQELFDFYLWQGQLEVAIHRRNGTFADPNITARFFDICLSAVIALALVPVRARWATTAVCALLGIALVLTFSRFGWLLALALGVGWLLVALRRWGRLELAAFGLAVALAVITVPHAIQRAGDVTSAISGDAPTGAPSDLSSGGKLTAGARPTVLDPILAGLPIDDERRYLLRAGVAMVEDHPLLGVGLGGFQPMLLGPYLDYVPKERRPNPTSLPHTELAKTAAETGLVGLLVLGLFLAAAAASLLRLARARDPATRLAGLALAAVIATIFLAAQAEGRFWTEPYLWLALGALGGLAGERSTDPGTPDRAA